MEQFTQEIMPAVTQLVIVAVRGLIGWMTTALKSWLDERGALGKLEKYDYLAEIAVKAVEQVYKNEGGAQKKALAKQMFLDSLPKKANITAIQLDSFLESAVKRMNDDWNREVIVLDETAE